MEQTPHIRRFLVNLALKAVRWNELIDYLDFITEFPESFDQRSLLEHLRKLKKKLQSKTLTTETKWARTNSVEQHISAI